MFPSVAKATVMVMVTDGLKAVPFNRFSSPWVGRRPISANLRGSFRPNSHKIVILSGAPTDLSRDTALGGAESKDPGAAYLPMLFRAFQPPNSEEQNLPCYFARMRLRFFSGHPPWRCLSRVIAV